MERHPKRSAIQNFRQKLTSEFDEDLFPQRIAFLPVPHPSRGEVPENASAINRSICDNDATKRPKARITPYNSPATNDVSQGSVIPRTLTKSPDHVREVTNAPRPRAAEFAFQKTILAERPNAVVARWRDASRQIKKWPLAGLRRSSVSAAKPKTPNHAISGG